MVLVLVFDSEAERAPTIFLTLAPPLEHKTMALAVSMNEEGELVWACEVGGDVKTALPAGCLPDADAEVRIHAAKAPQPAWWMRWLGKL